MSYKNVVVEKEGAIATVRINRPEVLNALNQETFRELKRAVEELRNDGDIKVLILTGTGDRAFSAGKDLKGTMVDPDALAAFKDRSGDYGPRKVFRAIETLEKPVIAAINGYALGGGCELALACDIRVASEKAMLGITEINVGIMPPAQRVTRLVGKGKAMELILTGDRITAHEAERIGLVDHVVPHEELGSKVREIAEKIASKSALALKLTKLAAIRGMDLDQESADAYEMVLGGLSYDTEDVKEGFKAFLEKRKPDFKGK